METKYTTFFTMLPKAAQLTVKMLVPHKYKQIDTGLLACVFCKHGLIKKCVSDNLKDVADRVVNNKLKIVNGEKELFDFEQLDLSDECVLLLDNFLYFYNTYSDLISTEIITAYVSYIMITDNRLNSNSIFNDILYVKSKEPVTTELLNILSTVIPCQLSETLTQYGTYLVNSLLYKHYDCVGREQEIQDSIDILCQMRKNNVILVGNPGVGKTSIVYGICNVLQSDKCPKAMRGFPVLELNINKLVSGTTYRGDLEKRLDTIITELKKYPNTILFIDEIHLLFNKPTGGEEGMSIQTILKPYLANNSKVIGCTTDADYKIIEKDRAFERRFSIVRVEELDKQKTVQTLIIKKPEYEKFYEITISDEICEHLVNLCHIYIKNRYFPDKAFDILDSSCVSCKKRGGDSLQISDIQESVKKAAGIDPMNKNILSVDAVKDRIKRVVFGQDNAIDAVCNAFKKYYLGVNDKTKPIGSFLFVGPTGTGKTEICKQVARNFFTEESFIRYDMSEFKESHSVSKLIGSPPGYVGYSQGGSLTEKVKHNPFSIILFDEIEKAHMDVINILLQIMDDGRLTDSFGSTVNFCNCLIVMTSNLGCREYLEKHTIGFSQSSVNIYAVTDEINRFFSPEFRNRIDKIVYFNQISNDIFNKVFEKELTQYIEAYSTECGVDIEMDEETALKVRSKCYNEKDGVRFIRRRIAEMLDEIIINSIQESAMSIELKFNERETLIAVNREIINAT